MVYGNIQLLLKVATHPEIMIAGKGLDLQAAIGELCQLAQEAGIPLRDHIFVFEPGIKNITYKEQLCRIGLYLVEPTAQALFPLYAGCMVGNA